MFICAVSLFGMKRPVGRDHPVDGNAQQHIEDEAAGNEVDEKTHDLI